MSKEFNEYKTMSLEKLKKKRKDLKLLMASCNRGTNPKIPIMKNSNVRQSIARVETLIKQKSIQEKNG